MARPCPHPTGDPRPERCHVCRRYVESPAHRAYYDSLVLPPRRGLPAGHAGAGAPRHHGPARPGPGAELKSLLASLGFAACLRCAELAREMDAWGVEGCRRPENEAVILGRLRERAAESTWAERLRAGVAAAGAGLLVNPLDPAPGLLAEAVRRAEARAAEASAPWRWVSTADLVGVTLRKLLPATPPDVAGVCGVARSGMLPAAALATALHLPLWEVSQHGGEPRELATGSRGVAPPRGGRLLVVDDTVYSGRAMSAVRRRLRGAGHLYAAAFARPGAGGACDLVGEELPSPHLLEWNLLNSGPLLGHAINPAMRGGVALDLDGVVCVDPTVDEIADPAGYAAWLADARPLMLPRRAPAPLVITARLEAHRAPTLAWCRRWGARVDRLEMWPGDAASRARSDVAAWKAGLYAASGCSLYVESDPRQAERMAALSGRPVACPAAGRVFAPGAVAPKPPTP